MRYAHRTMFVDFLLASFAEYEIHFFTYFSRSLCNPRLNNHDRVARRTRMTSPCGPRTLLRPSKSRTDSVSVLAMYQESNVMRRSFREHGMLQDAWPDTSDGHVHPSI